MTAPQCRNLVGGGTRTPSEAIADCRFKTIEVAGVNLRGLRCLKAWKDFSGVRPPVGVDRSRFEAKSLQRVNDAAEAVDDLRLAIVEKAVIDKSKPGESICLGRRCRRERRSEQRSVFKIAEKPAQGIKALCQMRSAAPVAAAKRGAIARKPAECSGHAD